MGLRMVQAAPEDGPDWPAPPPESLMWVQAETGEPEVLAEVFLDLGACCASTTAAGSQGAPDAAGASGDACPEVMRASPSDSVPLWKRSAVAGLFGSDVDLAALGEAVRLALELEKAPTFEVRPLEDRDWLTHVQQNWEPLKLGQGFEVLLPWHEGPAGGERLPVEGDSTEGRIVVRLEGGAAFGLGDHPTTQGAVAFLERTVPPLALGGRACRVLDYGTGSGVLAICAALLGASAATGVDVDGPSVASARRGWAANCPGGSSPSAVQFLEGPPDAEEAEALVQRLVEEGGQFDVVVANILRRPLVSLAPALAAGARPGAALALTGLRCDLGDFGAIQQAYEPHFEGLREVRLDGGWLLVEGRRK